LGTPNALEVVWWLLLLLVVVVVVVVMGKVGDRHILSRHCREGRGWMKLPSSQNTTKWIRRGGHMPWVVNVVE